MQKWYFSYVEKVLTEDKHYFSRGNILHEVIAESFLGLDKPIDFYYHRCEEVFEKYRQAGAVLAGGVTWPEAKVLDVIKQAFHESYKMNRSRKGLRPVIYNDGVKKDILAFELPFKIPFVDLKTMNPIPDMDRDLYGFIDEITIDNQFGFQVRDHKLQSERAVAYEVNMDLQLGLYAYVVMFLHRHGCFPDMIGKKLDSFTVGLNSLKIKSGSKASGYKKSVDFKFQDRIITLAEARESVYQARDIYYNMRKGKPVPNPTPKCEFACDFKEPCLMKRRQQDWRGWIASNNIRLKAANKKKALIDELITDLGNKELF
jgi:hypothetical protein